jgi:predicted NBD/HSP70 family sugar kinase
LPRKTEDIRLENLVKLLLELFKSDSTREELKKSLKVGTSTLSYLISELMKLGFIEESRRIYNLGRPSQVVGLKKDAWNILGIKIGREAVSGVLFDSKNNELERFSRPIFSNMRANSGYEKALRDVLNYFKSLKMPLLGIGVCASGTVDSHKGRIVYSPVMNVKDFSISGIIENIFGKLPVSVLNDVDSLATLEAFLNPEKDALLVSYGIGIGASYIHEGRVFNPVRGLSSFEIGHVIVENKGNCYCGQIGCLEYHSSEYAILKHYLGIKKSFKYFIEKEEEVFRNSLIELREKARNPDDLLLEAYKKAFHYLALVLGDLIVILKPARVILFGEGVVGDWMAELLKEQIFQRFNSLVIGNFEMEVEHQIKFWEEGAAFSALLNFLPLLVASKRAN